MMSFPFFIQKTELKFIYPSVKDFLESREGIFKISNKGAIVQIKPNIFIVIINIFNVRKKHEDSQLVINSKIETI